MLQNCLPVLRIPLTTLQPKYYVFYLHKRTADNYYPLLLYIVASVYKKQISPVHFPFLEYKLMAGKKVPPRFHHLKKNILYN